MEYTPPPLFKQGASARAKMLIFALIALGLLMADSHLKALAVVRQAVGVALYPLQVVAMLPRDAFFATTDYFSSLSTLKVENARMKEQQVLNAQQLQQSQILLAENAHLRKLLAAYPGLWEAIEEPRPGGVTTWEVYDAHDLVAIVMSERTAQALCDLRDWLASAVREIEHLRAQLQAKEGTL